MWANDNVNSISLHVFFAPDIDECASDSSNPCNQICTNTDGSFECSCMSGFQLESDGFTCEG